MYFKPIIDANGIKVPDYASIRDFLLAEFRRIFGQDLYLGADSQDYQMISLFAMALDDANSLTIEAYNNRNPDYASGNSLDMLLPLNGLTRIAATHSTVVLTLTGDPGTVIPAGSAALDWNGKRWIIQSEATIGAGGSVNADARAEYSGRIVAGIGAINQIGTPTGGWVSVTNAAPAVPGRDLETDAELRARRLSSLETQAVGATQAMLGALYKVPGVTGVMIYENSSAENDSNGIPPHSICVVIEGGSASEIAKVIYAKKSPGCGLYGAVQETITDIFGNSVVIKFTRPTQFGIAVEISLKAFTGYSSETADRIKAAVSAHISGLRIGETLENGLLWGVIVGQNPTIGGATFSPTSVKMGLVGGAMSDTPITPQYSERFICEVANITITTV